MSNNKTVRVPQQARSIEKHRRIVDAAITQFTALGFDGTNAKSIAKEAGVSVGTFYSYFEDKKAVLMAILAQHTADVDRSVFAQLETAIQDRASGREIMSLAVMAGRATHTQPPGLLRMMLALRYTDDDIANLHQAEEEAMLTKLTALFQMLGPRLRVTDYEAAARVVGAAFEETMHAAVVSEQSIEKERLFDALTDMTATYLFIDPDKRG